MEEGGRKKTEIAFLFVERVNLARQAGKASVL